MVMRKAMLGSDPHADLQMHRRVNALAKVAAQ
jgi:hypothetical protein